MIKEKDYLKAKQIVQEYENQLNISDVRNNFLKLLHIHLSTTNNDLLHQYNF